MKKCAFICVVGLLAFVWSATAASETVWLKDVTTRFQTDKRKLSGLDLPDQLTFHLTHGSDVLTLHLKRNYDINPNADIYVLRTLKDGQSFLEKTLNLEREDVAYYQDRDNGAFMTVRCVKRSNKQCDRVINGNIGIRGSNYDLRPAEADVTSRTLLEVSDLLGKRYVLQDQATMTRANSVENKDAANVNVQYAEQELRPLLRRFKHGLDTQNNFPRSDATLAYRYVAGLIKRGATDKTRQQKQDYYVEIAVMIDSSIWDLYASRVLIADTRTKEDQVKLTIREAYSHIMNGVNLRYKTIEDTSISISITLHQFIFFPDTDLFPHNRSKLVNVDGKQCINSKDYLDDLFDWDKEVGANYAPSFDHAMLFTKHDLYLESPCKRTTGGISFLGGVCDTGSRTTVIEARDYSRTVQTATHELGHNLGADHDGEGNASECNAADLFIMTPHQPRFNKTRPYSRNPWIFSNCSVEMFKNTLKDKHCLTNKGMFYNVDEWTMHMKKQAGDVFTPDEQCYLKYGPNSRYCGKKREEICHVFRCTHPQTGKCLKRHISAARGTVCGLNMWCIEGRCVYRTCELTK